MPVRASPDALASSSSEYLLGLAYALPPVIGPTLGVCDCEDDHTAHPDHEWQVVFAKLRNEIHPADHTSADVVMQRVFGDPDPTSPKAVKKGVSQILPDRFIIFNDLAQLPFGSRMLFRQLHAAAV